VPDRSSGETHYYGDLGFRTNATGAVTEVVIPCS
jgi:hypothetical protein